MAAKRSISSRVARFGVLGLAERPEMAHSAIVGDFGEKQVSVAVNPLRISEKRFMATVIAYAKVLGYCVYHTHDSRRSPAGFPDLVLIKRPRIIFAELKAEGKRPTQAQRDWIEELRACGLPAYVWWPSSFASIERALTATEEGIGG